LLSSVGPARGEGSGLSPSPPPARFETPDGAVAVDRRDERPEPDPSLLSGGSGRVADIVSAVVDAIAASLGPSVAVRSADWTLDGDRLTASGPAGVVRWLRSYAGEAQDVASRVAGRSIELVIESAGSGSGDALAGSSRPRPRSYQEARTRKTNNTKTQEPNQDPKPQAAEPPAGNLGDAVDRIAGRLDRPSNPDATVREWAGRWHGRAAGWGTRRYVFELIARACFETDLEPGEVDRLIDGVESDHADGTIYRPGPVLLKRAQKLAARHGFDWPRKQEPAGAF